MTDLPAYEAALVERVARVLSTEASGDEELWITFRSDARAALRALGLFGPSRTHWLAPWEATWAMVSGGFDEKPNMFSPSNIFSAMRDAHLQKGTT